MFGKNKTEQPNNAKPTPEPALKEKPMKSLGSNTSNTTTLIAEGTEIIGDIKFKGNLEIEGKVCGNVIALDDGGSTVRVLESGEIEGTIEVPSVVVNGHVKGNINSSSHIQLAENARVEGDVQYSSIEMTKGAHIYGKMLNDNHRPSTPQAVISENIKSGASLNEEPKAH